MALTETAEIILSQRPDRLIMTVEGLDEATARYAARQALRIARKNAPKMSGDSAKRMGSIYGEGFFGITFQDCVAVGTRVLTADWRWVPVETLGEGDALIGFDESTDRLARGRGRGRRYRTAYVTGASVQSRPCVEIAFDDGTSVVCTENHPWLAKKYRDGTAREWILAEALKPGHLLGVYFEPWEDDETFEGGWLSGMFDGEGSYVDAQNVQASGLPGPGRYLYLTQNIGPVLDHAMQVLKDKGFEFAVRGKTLTCRTLEIAGGFAEQMRLLGSLRPLRLLPKAQHENRSMAAVRERQVVSVTHVGERDVVVMGTTEQTYMAEGMGSHNSYVWFQENGIKAFTMNNLQGKTIPMWIDDPTGQERGKNPKAKTRTTASGKTQVLIFRKAAVKGQRKTVTRRGPGGVTRQVDVPMSYPGAPGRIGVREASKPHTTPGKVAGAIARGNSGVRWRHPGLSPRFFLNNALTMAAQNAGILPIRIYVTDGHTKVIGR